MRQYIGITIGPIFDTISDAVTPAALWFASTLFSDITRRICLALNQNFQSLILYSPAFDKEDVDGLTEGVGKYHDRVIFSVENQEIDSFNNVQENSREKALNDHLDHILDDIKRETITQIESEKKISDPKYEEKVNFLQQYIQINYIVMPEAEVGDTNCILKLSPYLDALELMKTFPEHDGYNPIRITMEGIKVPKKDEKDEIKVIECRNKKIKESRLFTKGTLSGNQFIGDGAKRIYEIKEIADCHGKVSNMLKYGDYYAVVSADADGMGNFLNTITNREVTWFSECCLEYAKEAARLIGDFCGMTIYAGGDDLLFLSPVYNLDANKSIFKLCQEISELFSWIVNTKEINGRCIFENKPIPTVSFGISIQFHKFPLYEALAQSRQMLEEAKNQKFKVEQTNKQILSGLSERGNCQKWDEVKKNCVVFNLEKHSGRSIRVLVGNEVMSSFCEFVTEVSEKSDDKKLKGIISKLEKLYYVITALDAVKARPVIARMNYESGYTLSEEEKQSFETWKRELWDNLFDNQGQAFAKDFIHSVCGFYYTDLIENQMRCMALYTDKMTIDEAAGEQKKDPYPNKTLNVLIEILRYCMFLKEKAGE